MKRLHMNDSVMTAGTAISADSQPTRLQRNIIVHDYDMLWWDVIETGQLLNGIAGQIHISLGLEQENFSIAIGYLVI